MRILITAGPTREYLDPVRYLSNASSGKLGYAIAAAAARRGHRVELVSGPVELAAPKGVKVTRVVTAGEMLRAATAIFTRCDAAIMAAAVCDYRPVRSSKTKLHRSARGRTLRLVPNRDICAHLGRIKRRRVVVGFALEDRDGPARAAEKLRRKRCDAIVLNDPGTIASDQATVQILLSDGRWLRPFRARKHHVAVKLVALTEAIVAAKAAPVVIRKRP